MDELERITVSDDAPSLWNLDSMADFLPVVFLPFRSVTMQLKILHTRVLGQFTVICTLLGVMGLKEMMDRQGKFVTEAEVEQRVLEMEKTRMDLMDRLEYQAQQQSTAMKGRLKRE